MNLAGVTITGAASAPDPFLAAGVAAGDLLVVTAAVAAMAWVNWYFFVSKQGSAVASAGPGGAQEVTVTVRGGYSPAVVQVQRGRPVRLVFDRQETAGCSEEVVLPAFGVKRFLPPMEKTVVEFTPEETGRFEFTCGMQMLRGRIDVVEREVGGDS